MKRNSGQNSGQRKGRRTVPGWPGYIHRQSNGLDLFIIERQIRGKRYHVSTGANTITAAREQLERFTANPEAYDPRGGRPAAGLVITDKLVEEWESFQLAKGNTPVYVRDHARKVLRWMLRLNGVDVRTLTLRQLRDALEGETARKHRIIALKSFCSWLRTEKGLLTTAQDATLDLEVPQSAPAKWKKRKAVAWDDVERVLTYLEAEGAKDALREPTANDKLDPGADALRRRDCLLLLTATGWHVTELQRFIKGGELLRQAGGDVLAVLVVRHKGGELTRTPLIHREHLEAAERLRASGEVPRRLHQVHRQTCVAAGVPHFGLGVMRHSVATWAVEAGELPERVAHFLGHKDPRTTKRFYSDVAVPTNVIPLRRVKH